MTTPRHDACREAREAIHATLDTGLVDAELKRRLDEHLAGCGECRAFAAETHALQQGLRSLAGWELPDEVLERVWAQTSRAKRAPVWIRPRRLVAAAAMLVMLILGGVWVRQRPASDEPSPEELRRAATEARMVLQLASNALQKTESAAFGDVLGGEVSEALRHAPIQWPERGSAERRGS